MTINGVIAIEVNAQEIVERISARRTCLQCGSVTNLNIFEGASIASCRMCGGSLVQREDDNETVVRKRLDDYRHVTEPLLKYYEKQGILHTIDGLGNVDTVGMRIAQVLDQIEQSRQAAPDPA
jgi:adenylate kinase